MIKHIGTKPKNIFPAGCIFYQEEAIVSDINTVKRHTKTWRIITVGVLLNWHCHDLQADMFKDLLLVGEYLLNNIDGRDDLAVSSKAAGNVNICLNPTIDKTETFGNLIILVFKTFIRLLKRLFVFWSLLYLTT